MQYPYKFITRRQYYPRQKAIFLPQSLPFFLQEPDSFLNLPFRANFYKLTGMSGTYHYYYYYYEVLTNLPIWNLFFAILFNLFFVNIVDLFFLIFFGKIFLT